MNLKQQIEYMWESKELDSKIISQAMDEIDSGQWRAAVYQNGTWHTDQYVKKAILLYFRISKNVIHHFDCENVFDKIPMKTRHWDEQQFSTAGFRMVPGAFVRYPAHIAQNVVLMPCFVNVGAYVDQNTMIDSHALVGSCAQIGKNCHISDSVTIGGVLEPIQANPVIVEDDCFIGAKSVVTEGVIIKTGSVIAAGTVLSASTKIIDRSSGQIFYGEIPAYSVVVPGCYKSTDNISIGCAVIVKYSSPELREKVAINELLRGNDVCN